MDTLEIFGLEYQNVAGFKATDDNNNILTFIRPTGTQPITVTQNGTTTVDVTAYENAQITANVPNTYTSSDEGKVVSNGALVSQGSDTVTQNGTVDTTLINNLTVNVSGGGVTTDEGSLVLAENYSYLASITNTYTGLVIQTSLSKITTIALWSEEWADQTAARPCGGGFCWISTDTGVPKMASGSDSPYHYGAGTGMNATTSNWFGGSNTTGPVTHEMNSSVPAGSFGFRTHSATYPFKTGHTLRWKVWGEA